MGEAVFFIFGILGAVNHEQPKPGSGLHEIAKTVLISGKSLIVSIFRIQIIKILVRKILRNDLLVTAEGPGPRVIQIMIPWNHINGSFRLFYSF
ncbi:hypothetical protein D3C71_1817860 [compost metagenome]